MLVKGFSALGTDTFSIADVRRHLTELFPGTLQLPSVHVPPKGAKPPHWTGRHSPSIILLENGSGLAVPAYAPTAIAPSNAT